MAPRNSSDGHSFAVRIVSLFHDYSTNHYAYIYTYCMTCCKNSVFLR